MIQPIRIYDELSARFHPHRELAFSDGLTDLLRKNANRTGNLDMTNLLSRMMIGLCVAGLAMAGMITPGVAGLLDKHIQKTSFPHCDDIDVLGMIVERFNWEEEKTWHRGFYLEDIERVRERVVQSSSVSSIPRRYCRAHARLTNGKHPTLYYLIEGGQGFAGNHFNVEFCLGGLDRWNEYDGSCRVLRY